MATHGVNRRRPRHVTVLALALAMTGCECGDSHLRADASVDASGGRLDARFDDARTADADRSGDGSSGESRCDFDLAGSWTRTFDRSPGQCAPDEDQLEDLTADGLFAHTHDPCASDGCTAENCRVVPAAAPECTLVVVYESPCTGLPIGHSFRYEHRVISPTRIEGHAVLMTALGQCAQDYVLTR